MSKIIYMHQSQAKIYIHGNGVRLPCRVKMCDKNLKFYFKNNIFYIAKHVLKSTYFIFSRTH